MSRLGGTLLLMLLAAVTVAIEQALENEEIRAIKYMEALDAKLSHQKNLNAKAEWVYESNVTEYNVRLKNEASAERAIFFKVSAPCSRYASTLYLVFWSPVQKIVKEVRAFDYDTFKDDDLKRKFRMLR